jgi:hypothetical protein
MKLLSAITTKERGIQPSRFVFGKEALAIERDRALLCVKGGVYMTGTGKKAV